MVGITSKCSRQSENTLRYLEHTVYVVKHVNAVYTQRCLCWHVVSRNMLPLCTGSKSYPEYVNMYIAFSCEIFVPTCHRIFTGTIVSNVLQRRVKKLKKITFLHVCNLYVLFINELLCMSAGKHSYLCSQCVLGKYVNSFYKRRSNQGQTLPLGGIRKNYREETGSLTCVNFAST